MDVCRFFIRVVSALLRISLVGERFVAGDLGELCKKTVGKTDVQSHG